jgi:catechol 2,3-dioxygenase-like lactoylglutathione lyase family enzyme
MASDSSLSWTNRTVLRPGREEPYLCIQDIIIFVRDLDVSLRFYVDQLGFELIADRSLPSFGRWIEVAPPDGSAKCRNKNEHRKRELSKKYNSHLLRHFEVFERHRHFYRGTRGDISKLV